MKEISGNKYFDKREALDHIAWCAKRKTPIHGVEVVSIEGNEIRTGINKSAWFKTQRGVYATARLFVLRQMVGEWNWVEIKHE
jgi:hypothetical protein